MYQIDKHLIQSVLVLLDVETVNRGQFLIDNYIGLTMKYRAKPTVQGLNDVIDAHHELRRFLQDVQTKWITGGKRIHLYIHWN